MDDREYLPLDPSDALMCLEESGLAPVICHQALTGSIQGDLDVFVSRPTTDSMLRFWVALSRKGLSVTSIWPSDVDTVNLFIYRADSCQVLQLDMVSSPRGSVGYGVRTSLANADAVESLHGFRELNSIDRAIYLLAKRLTKAQYSSAFEARATLLRCTSDINTALRRVDQLLIPERAKPVKSFIQDVSYRLPRRLSLMRRGSLPNARGDLWYSALTARRFVRRLAYPVGRIVRLPTSVSTSEIDSLARSFAGASLLVEAIDRSRSCAQLVAATRSSFIGFDGMGYVESLRCYLLRGSAVVPVNSPDRHLIAQALHQSSRGTLVRHAW